jgi:lipopolysaccharide biosynthesis regulator YciM
VAPSAGADKGGGYWPLAAGTLFAFALALALWQRRRNAPAPMPASEPTLAAETTFSPSVALAPTQERTSVAHSRQSSLQTLARIEVDDETVDEHAAAIELAEIMMGFGRVQGAADTLADFIQNHPKQAVTPWLKLLEVYRAAGMRSEFQALTRRLNKTFNVKAVAWEDFELSRKNPVSLEALPHVMAQISERWGTRDSQRYLQSLLRDNREGTREGFPLPVVDDILLLAAVLDLQLGPLPPAAA